MKDSTKLKLVKVAYGSNKHEGMEDPYRFMYEVKYRYYFNEITKKEFFRLCEEYYAAMNRIEDKDHQVTIKA